MATDEKRGEVVMLPGADRPEDALKWLAEALGTATGVVVVTVGDGHVECRLFGNVPRHELAYAGVVLADHAVNG